MDTNDSKVRDTESISIEELNDKIKIKNDELAKCKKDKNMNLGLGLVFICVALLILYLSYNKLNTLSIISIFAYIGIAFFGLFGIFGTSMFFDNSKIESATQELMYLEDEMELLDAKNLGIEARADKQFRLNQRELKRYYDMNLSQTKFLSTFGIFLMISGLIIILITIYIYNIQKGSSNTLLLVGCISGILIDFLGAIFIATYTKTVETAIRFHSKLANSNNLLLANTIASKIKDDSLRNITLSEVAKNISLSQGHEQ